MDQIRGAGHGARPERPSPTITTLFQYNLRDWLTHRTNDRDEDVEFRYDANGNRNRIEDAENNPTQILYDERNLPFTRTDAEGRVVTFHYHENGTLHRLLDGEGHETRYDYDGHDRLETTTHEATSSHPITTEVRGYDANGNLTSWKTRAGDVFAFTYDDLNRRRTRTTPADAATFDYDLAGRMTGAANSAVSWAYAYNARHELVTETAAIPGLSPLTLQHNNVNRANQDTDPYLPQGNGPAPNGDFIPEPMVSTPGGPDSALGDKGFIPLDLRPLDENGQPENRIEGGGNMGPGRGGVGIHAGRVGRCDGAGRCENHATQGCIRTTPEAMDALAADPPTHVRIQD